MTKVKKELHKLTKYLREHPETFSELMYIPGIYVMDKAKELVEQIGRDRVEKVLETHKQVIEDNSKDES